MLSTFTIHVTCTRYSTCITHCVPYYTHHPTHRPYHAHTIHTKPSFQTYIMPHTLKLYTRLHIVHTPYYTHSIHIIVQYYIIIYIYHTCTTPHIPNCNQHTAHTHIWTYVCYTQHISHHMCTSNTMPYTHSTIPPTLHTIHTTYHTTCTIHISNHSTTQTYHNPLHHM